MASYIESTLIKGEQIIYTGHVSLWSLTPLILLGLVLLPLFGVGLVFWLVAFIRYKSTEVAITNKRVIAKFGFISRKTIEMSLAKVESVQVDQGLLGRLFDFGTLVVSGAGNPQAPIPGISDPMNFRRACMERLDQNLTPAVA
jgi:uncharacterized membrane protein YdbT with pleckstrin-like domain